MQNFGYSKSKHAKQHRVITEIFLTFCVSAEIIASQVLSIKYVVKLIYRWYTVCDCAVLSDMLWRQYAYMCILSGKLDLVLKITADALNILNETSCNFLDNFVTLLKR